MLSITEHRARLKHGKEKSLLRRHPWIFSGAIQELPADCEAGELLPVYSSEGQFLATAYFHPTHSLCGRVLSFKEGPLEEILREKILEASLRRDSFSSKRTNAYRLINAEGDGLPGLVVDRYGDVLVVQATTAGIARLLPLLVKLLVDILQPKAIYEKSLGSARRQEGLPDQEGILWGQTDETLTILENGMQFAISLTEGQKTGFFLDQREMRKLTRSLAAGRAVLNGFAYTGGFSIAALLGGATRVDSVEISSKTRPFLEQNLALNGCEASKHRFFCEDMFDFLARMPLDYDLIILDPPAFAKKRVDVEMACMGYKRLFREIFSKAKKGTLLLFSSCSYYIDAQLFETLAYQAALETNCNVLLLSKHRQASDHPVSLFHPEGQYLKSLFLAI